MKINEFLAEINMLPEAVHLLNELQESGRIGEEEYQENKLLYEKDRALFYEKFFWKRIIGLCFCIIYAAWAPKPMMLMKSGESAGKFSGTLLRSDLLV